MVRVVFTPLRAVTGVSGLRRIGRIDPTQKLWQGVGVGGGVLSLICGQHIAILEGAQV